jgi:hypothetical protein
MNVENNIILTREHPCLFLMGVMCVQLVQGTRASEFWLAPQDNAPIVVTRVWLLAHAIGPGSQLLAMSLPAGFIVTLQKQSITALTVTPATSAAAVPLLSISIETGIHQLIPGTSGHA